MSPHNKHGRRMSPSDVRTSRDLAAYLSGNPHPLEALELVKRLVNTPDWVLLAMTEDVDRLTIRYLPTHDTHTIKVLELP